MSIRTDKGVLMLKSKFMLVVAAVALVAWVGASSASAQTAPVLEADPAHVNAPGTYAINLLGSGFTAGSVNVTACDTGNVDDVTAETFVSLCGVGSVATAEGDGGFSASLEVDVPAEGVVIVMTELAPNTDQVAMTTVNVDADEDSDADMDMDTEYEDEGMDADMGMDGEDVDESMDVEDEDADMGMGTDEETTVGGDMSGMEDDMGMDDMDQPMGDDMSVEDEAVEEMPETGVNSAIPFIVGIATLLAGAMLFAVSRRLNTH